VITPFLVLIYRARRELWEAYRRPRWSRSALILAGLSPLLFQVAISAVHGLGFDFLSWTEPWVAADWSVAGLVRGSFSSA
jgi:hypothetical protein